MTYYCWICEDFGHSPYKHMRLVDATFQQILEKIMFEDDSLLRRLVD